MPTLVKLSCHLKNSTQLTPLLLDPELIKTTREYIPLYHQRRFDIYGDVSETVRENQQGQVVAKK